MNGFAALDIHPHRRYVVDIGGRRSCRCRLHINFAPFLHSLDFTQNLGVTPNWISALRSYRTSRSNEQAPVSMEPGKGSLNNPAVLSKMRGTVHPTSGNAVLYMSHCARLSAKRKIVPFISVKFLRTTSGSPVQISQGRQMIQHIFQHFTIIHIGGSEADNKRNAIAIRYEMMFTSRTTSIYGVGSCVFAPFLPG